LNRQPITYVEIAREQLKDKGMKHLRDKAPHLLGEVFEDLGKRNGADKVTTLKDPVTGQTRIAVPAKLTHRLISWYHNILVHRGTERLYNTLRQHYTWPEMLVQVKEHVKQCDASQKAKRGVRGMGKVPIKDTEIEPWRDIAIDLSGPWKAMVNSKERFFHTLTIIDVFTGWPEIVPIDAKTKQPIADLVEQEWFRRCPIPSRVIFDQGGEFDNNVFHGLCTKWFIHPVPITAKNPRANAIVERMHRVLGDMLRVELVKCHEKDDPIKDLTSAAAYAMRDAVHGVTKYTPSQLVFAKDIILRTTMEANVELARQRREAAISQNNARENKSRVAHNYKKGDWVLILSRHLDPKLQLHPGPFKVLSYEQS